MYLVLAQLLILFHFARSATIPQYRRDALPSPGTARFDARHVYGRKDIERRGTIETGEAAPWDSLWYQCTVGVGDQSFTLQFDSGSADLWIPAPQIESEIGSQHTFYEPSSSATLTGASWYQGYGEVNTASGVVYTDTVTFGSITLQNQPVEVATSTTFDDIGYDGILGISLGQNGISPSGTFPTFLNSVYDLLEEPVFTAKLTRPSETMGFYTFGYIDVDTLGGQTVLSTSVFPTEPGYWAFPSTVANIGGNLISIPDNVAIADTGTTLIKINELVLNEIYSLLGGGCDTTGLGNTPCIFPQNADIPSITLYVGEYGVTLDPEDLIFSPAGGEYQDYYVGSVQPSTEGFDVFGDYFLRNIYAIFNFTNGNQQFAFVPRVPGT
jgi:aspergillopepsin I